MIRGIEQYFTNIKTKIIKFRTCTISFMSTKNRQNVT